MTWSTDECLLIQQMVKGNPKCEDFVVSKKSEILVWCRTCVALCLVSSWSSERSSIFGWDRGRQLLQPGHLVQ
ncbi:hypothetical protein PVK06_007021 [Gossypium arboreum]|uniref:Uncharacterized protein n=1 Tax=Gossypium arboreum TaxID=29729 RepID=A0ABR0QH04_GOSAR|nr:hypothetical protein PVK06_007021 [Gossypium arboreum]